MQSMLWERGYEDGKTDENMDAAIVYEKETGAVIGDSHAVFSAGDSPADIGLRQRSEARQQLRRKSFGSDGGRDEKLVRHFYRQDDE